MALSHLTSPLGGQLILIKPAAWEPLRTQLPGVKPGIGLERWLCKTSLQSALLLGTTGCRTPQKAIQTLVTRCHPSRYFSRTGSHPATRTRTRFGEHSPGHPASLPALTERLLFQRGLPRNVEFPHTPSGHFTCGRGDWGQCIAVT